MPPLNVLDTQTWSAAIQDGIGPRATGTRRRTRTMGVVPMAIAMVMHIILVASWCSNVLLVWLSCNGTRNAVPANDDDDVIVESLQVR